MKDQNLTMFELDYFSQSATKPIGLKLGCRRYDQYGTEYRLARAGATALAAGKNTSATEGTANHMNMSLASAAAIGATRVQVTLGATAATANQYEDGFMVVNDGTGEGHMYRIKSNPAADASATLWVELVDPIRVALVTAGTSEVSLFPNTFGATVISADINSVPTGIPPIAVTATYYYWSVTNGEVPVLTTGTDEVGTIAVASTTDGGMAPLLASTDDDNPIIGVVLGQDQASGEYYPIYYKGL